MISFFPGRFNGPLLAEEIELTFPEFFENTLEGRRALYLLTYDMQGVTLRVPDETDARALDILVKAHNPDGLSKHERDAQEAPGRKASIDAKLKALGMTAEELRFLLEYAQEESTK